MVNHWLIMAVFWLNHLPLWKMMEFVSWDYDIPNWMASHKILWFQTTNQWWCFNVFSWFWSSSFEPFLWLPSFSSGQQKLVGGIPTPLGNISQLRWLFPYVKWKIIQMFVTTNQEIIKLLHLPNQACWRFKKIPFQVAQSPADVPTQHQGGKEQPAAIWV